MDKDISIGYWIKRRRKSLDLTQKDLAALVGCALITIVKIEANQRKPSRETALLLAKHLQLPEEYHPLFVSVMRGEKNPSHLQRISFNASFMGEADSATWNVSSAEAVEGETMHGVKLLMRISRGKMVARASELALALNEWQTVLEGEARTLVILGEPGVGKSRLALELLDHIRREGGEGLVGDCFSGAERSYAPFSRILRNVREIPEGLSPVVITDLKIIAPQLEARFPNMPFLRVVDPLAEKLRLFESIFIFFKQIFQETPAAILIEDIHWADSGSLEVIQSLARRFKEAAVRVLFILTMRNEIPAGAYDVTSLIDELQRGHVSTSIRLERFDLEGTRALLASIFAQEITDDFIDLIHRETQGSPFFIEEVCKDLVERRDIYWTNGRWERSELQAIQVPKSVQFAIQARLQKLPQPSMEVLRMAAVLGRRFEFDTLKTAIDIEEEDLIQALEAAKQSQIIVDVDHIGGGSFEFSHSLICTVIIEDTSSPRRRKLHQQAVAALEKFQPNEFSILAWHCREADEKLRAAGYFTKAADRAMQTYTHDDALRYYSEALKLMEEDPSEMCRLYLLREKVYDLRGDRLMQLRNLEEARSRAEIAGDAGLRAEVELAFAEFYLQASDQFRVIEHVKNTILIAEEADLPNLQAQAYMLWGRTLTETSNLDEARERLSQAGELGRRAGLKLIEVRSLINLGNVDYRLGDYDAANKKYTEALVPARALGERRIECMTLNNMGNIAWLKGGLERALELYWEALSIAGEIGDRLNEGRTLSNIGSIFTEQFRHAEALQNLEQALGLFRDLGQRGDEAMALSHLGDVMEGLGKYETAYTYKEHALQIAREIEDPQGEAELLTGLSRIRFYMGNYFEAQKNAQDSIHLAQEPGLRVEEADGLSALGRVDFALGKWDDATEAFSRASTLFGEMGLDQKRREMLAELARLAEMKGDHAGALEYLLDVLPSRTPEALAEITEPSICLCCYLALKETDPIIAGALLERGHMIVAETLGRIPDGNARQHYGSVIPSHKLLLDLWRARTKK